MSQRGTPIPSSRAQWLARYILPLERDLRRLISRIRLPAAIEVEDVLQECYGRLAQLQSVEHIQDPRAYAFAIVRSIILKQLRHAQVVPMRSLEDLEATKMPIDWATPDLLAADREQSRMLHDAVEDLPEQARIIFRLRFGQELPYSRIGQMLGLSANAVQKSLARSVHAIGRKLGRGSLDEPRPAQFEEPGRRVRRP